MKVMEVERTRIWENTPREGDAGRQRAAQADAGQQPQDEQLGRIVRRRGEEGQEAEQHDAADGDPLVAEIAGQRRHEQITDQEPDLVGGQNPAQHVARDVPVLGDLRRDIADHLGVEAVDEQDHRAQHADHDLQAADAARIDHGIGVENLARPVHDVSHRPGA